jgi:dCMP deaminase
MSQPAPRLSRAELYMMTARLFGLRSSCPRAQVGAIAVADYRIIATGYVGAPSGMAHCLDVGCDIQDGGCVRTVHAEANVVGFAAWSGISLAGSWIYTTVSPCYTCAKLLVNAGIEGLVYDDDYRDSRGIELLRNLEIEVMKYDAESASRGLMG